MNTLRTLIKYQVIEQSWNYGLKIIIKNCFHLPKKIVKLGACFGLYAHREKIKRDEGKKRRKKILKHARWWKRTKSHRSDMSWRIFKSIQLFTTVSILLLKTKQSRIFSKQRIKRITILFFDDVFWVP